MHKFAYFLTCISKSLLDWKSVGLDALDKGIRDTEFQLQALDLEDPDSSFSDNHYANHRALNHRFIALLKQNSIRWAQRARLMWVKDGNRNTNVFHNTAKSVIILTTLLALLMI